MRSDIFAFGAVLYEMLTGKRAFERKSSSDIIIAVAREEPTPLRDLVKDVPEELKRIVKRCLRKQPEDRYQSIAEVERELEECRALTSGPISGINLKVLLRQSKRPRVALPALAILLAVGLLARMVVKPRSQSAVGPGAGVATDRKADRRGRG